MLAAVFRATGPAADVLNVEEVPTPEPGPGEVRVRLRVAGVNPTDWKSRVGLTGAAPADFQVTGQDGAGDIDAVGPGVDEARVGQKVWVWFAGAGRPWGTAAQYTIVPERHAVPLPADASYDLGASLGIPGMTASHCLFADGPLPGATVLVAGGAGAVGNAAIALARLHGARVVSTVSGPEKGELARAAGAHVVVNYRDADAADQIRAAAPNGVARIVEVALGANLALDLAVLARGGTISTYANDELHDLPIRSLMVANAKLAFVLIYWLSDLQLAAAVHGVVEAVNAGAFPTLPFTRFPLADAAKAHDAVEANTVGKVLIDIP